MLTNVISLASTSSYASSLGEAARALRDGALVVFPTETVYGIAANATHPEAVARLRDVKGRHDNQPFTVHLARRADAARYVDVPMPIARRLARKAWAGPLTLVCEVSDPEKTEIAALCPREQLGAIFHGNTVGLRCPDHPDAARLLGEAGVPIIASSANRAGRKPPCDFPAALHELEGVVEYALDGGATRLSAPSTIVEVGTAGWSLRRQGAIEERTIHRLARSEVLFVCTGNSCRSPLAEYLFREALAERLGMSGEKLADSGYFVSSAGTFALAGGHASTGTVEELHRRGIDAGGHRSQPLTVELIQRVERVYAMTQDHLDAARQLVPAVGDRVELLDGDTPVADPIGGGSDDYARCAEQIERAVARRVEEFVDEDRHW